MNALEIANEILAEMDALIPDELLLATGSRSMKEYVINNDSGKRMFCQFFIARVGCTDKAIEVLNNWK